MANNYGRLVVELSANVAQLKTDVGQAVGIVQGGAQRLNGIAAGMRSAFAGIVGGLSFAAITAGIKSTIDDLDELGKAAARSGLAAQSFAGFDAAFKQAGGAAGELESAIAKLNDRMGEASSGQNERLAAQFRQLGVDVKQGTEPALIALAGVFARIESPAERANLATDLFGRSAGPKMAEFLRQGSAAVAEQARRMGEISGVTDDAVRQAAEFNDRLDDLAQQASAAGRKLTSDLLPGLAQTATRVRELLDEDKGVQALVRAFAGLGKLPLDLIFGGGAQIAKTQAGALAEMRKELAELERIKSDAKGSLLDRIFGTPKSLDDKISALKVQIGLMEKFGGRVFKQPAPPAAPADPGLAPLLCAAEGGVWDGKRCVKPTRAKTGASSKPSDPLASLISQTDTARLAEYEKLLNLLDARFDSGRKNAQQYQEAVALLNKQFGFEQIDPLGSGSFGTTSKQVADFIREQQDSINGLNAEMAAEGVRDAQEYESALAALIGDTAVAKTERLHENVDLLNRAFFDGKIGVEQYEEALGKLTTGKSEELKKTRSIAEELGLTFTSAFEDAVVEGKKFSDVLKGIAQDIQRVILRQTITRPLGNALAGAIGGLFKFADGGVMTSAGPLPLRRYAAGGVASSPQLALFGEGSTNEAFVPLPDGRRIPVEMRGGAGGVVINQTIAVDARGAEAGIEGKLRQAVAEGARQGYAMVVDDLSRGGTVARLARVTS